MRVVLSFLVAWLLPVAAIAQGVPTAQPQLVALLSSPTYKQFLQTSVNQVESPVLKARCANLKVIDANQFAVIIPGTFTPNGITGGMWLSIVNVDRCGAPATRRLLVQVGGLNGLSPTAMLPGDFRGDVRLESEISRAMTAEMMTFSNCKDASKFAIVDIKAQGAPLPSSWTELWTAESCGKFVTAYVDYVAGPQGATYSARDMKAQ